VAAVRILFSFVGGRGHFGPLVPVAGASAAAGHEIMVTCEESMVRPVQEAGFSASASGPDFGSDATRLPLLVPDPQREDHDLRRAFAQHAAPLRAKDILALARSWRPDLIVCDEVDFGAMIAAERLGVPYASVLVTASGGFAEACSGARRGAGHARRRAGRGVSGARRPILPAGR
jgi:UDP:flavonoid glycosyltransferase YjiC (YdhE family)